VFFVDIDDLNRYTVYLIFFFFRFFFSASPVLNHRNKIQKQVEVGISSPPNPCTISIDFFNEEKMSQFYTITSPEQKKINFRLI